MKFTSEVANKIGEAIKSRGAPRTCVLCGTNQWTLADGFYYFTTQEDFSNFVLGGGRGLPCAALICNNCGNTHFINLIQLGLQDLLQ